VEKENLSRREFLVGSAAAAGGLVIAFHVPSILKIEQAFAADSGKKMAEYPPNAFIRIAPDNSITITINRLEMGQGVNTSLSQLIAEELECPWEKIEAVASSTNAVYNAPGMPFILTGGSSSVFGSFDQYRKIGASLREMLKQAASQKWNVPASELKAENGFILHPKKGKLSYGELATAAGQLPLPPNPPLKDAKHFKVIGKSMKRVDASDKSTGRAVFGMDVRIPNMLYVVVAKPPIEGSKLVSIDKSAAKKILGVVDVVKFADRVAVLAKNTFAAKQGQEALSAKWDSGPNASASTDGFMKSFKEASQKEGLIAEKRGQVEVAMGKAHKKMTFSYEFPFLAHAPMEPMNCTINFDGKKAEIWSGHQMPSLDQIAAAKVLEIEPENVTVHTTYAGGSFGRRGNKVSDYVVEACQLAKVVKKPIKVVWTRENDMRGGYYRPMNFHQVEIGLDEKNHLVAWDHHIVGQGIMSGSPFEKMMVKNGIDPTVVEGVAETAYDLKNFRCQQTLQQTPMTTLWWRSVGHTHTAYVMETLIDELAEAAKHDPMEFRMQLLKKSPRHIAVLEQLKKETNWGHAKPPKGRAWGLAIHESFRSVVGHVVEVSIENGQPKAHKVWSSAHIGQVVNPAGAATQVEGAIVYGLSAALYGEIEVKDGEIVQSNFDDYPVCRMNEMPKISVSFVKSNEHPTGLGEPGLPPLAPAVANAVYRLTKKRVRQLPFSKGLKV
jgi:isoquinoline 1-oxidoreductase beta subunit